MFNHFDMKPKTNANITITRNLTLKNKSTIPILHTHTHTNMSALIQKSFCVYWTFYIFYIYIYTLSHQSIWCGVCLFIRHQKINASAQYWQLMYDWLLSWMMLTRRSHTLTYSLSLSLSLSSPSMFQTILIFVHCNVYKMRQANSRRNVNSERIQSANNWPWASKTSFEWRNSLRNIQKR